MTVAFLCQSAGMIHPMLCVNHTSTGFCDIRLQCNNLLICRKVVMTDELKSFKKDWQRWSAKEKLIAVTMLIALVALLGGPVGAGLL